MCLRIGVCVRVQICFYDDCTLPFDSKKVKKKKKSSCRSIKIGYQVNIMRSLFYPRMEFIWEYRYVCIGYSHYHICPTISVLLIQSLCEGAKSHQSAITTVNINAMQQVGTEELLVIFRQPMSDEKKKRRHISSRTHRRKSIYIHLIMMRIDAKADNTEFGCSETESETSDLLFDISIVQHLKCIPLRMCVAAKFILAKAI